MIVNPANSATGNSNAFATSWVMASGDTAAPLSFSQFTDKSVQVSGVFGGASVAFAGSNDGVNYFTLTDPQGNPLTFTTGKIKSVTEATVYCLPIVTGGDGTTTLTISVLMKE
jgi:hypothetical protein